MSGSSRRPQKIAAALSARCNPYWSLQLPDNQLSNAYGEATSADEQLHLSENPYATEYYQASTFSRRQATKGDPLQGTRAENNFAIKGVSKAHFRARCRQIFRYYIPEVERGRLRGHHREFISHNEDRTAYERSLILSNLEKYDLSDLAGHTTHFNRDEALTEVKLKQIESLIENTKS